MKLIQRILALTLSVVLIMSAVIIVSPFTAKAVNPYLPLWEHLPDGEPKIFEDPDNPGQYRAYIYGSHDTRYVSYCGPDIRAWSAPVDDLLNWRDEGPIFTYYINELWDTMFAPDIVEVRRRDGTKEYYLYPHNHMSGRLAQVCKGDSPTGPFQPINMTADGTGTLPGSIMGFDPGVWVEQIDDPGDPDYEIGFRAYAYWGYAGGEKSWACELDQNTMYSVRPGTKAIQYFMPCSSSYGVLNDPAGTTYSCLFPGEDPKSFNFFEASSIRKVGNKYVMIYSGYSGPDYGMGSTNAALRYCYSDTPLGPWKSGGVLVDARAPVLNQTGSAVAASYAGHNTHGSILEINGQWYCFYHRAPRGFGYARQPMVAPLKIEWTPESLADGGYVRIRAWDPYSPDNTWTAKDSQGREYTGAEVTSEGFEIYGLDPYKYYSAGIACYLSNTNSPQDSWDTWDNHMPLANVASGNIIGYKYFGFGGLDQDKNGLRAFEGTKPGNGTRFNLYLTPRTSAAFTIGVWLDGPWDNSTWRGKKIGEINVPAGSAQETAKFSVDVSAFVDDLDGKHAIFLVASGSGTLCDLQGLGFSSAQKEIAPPAVPKLNISVDGIPLDVPSIMPLRSTFENGLVDYNTYEHIYMLPPQTSGIPTVTASSDDKNIKVSVSQPASPHGTAVVRFIRGDAVKTYRISLSPSEDTRYSSDTWKVVNPRTPANPTADISSSGTSVTIQSKVGDSAQYPACGNILQLPFSIEGDWTITATVKVSPSLYNVSSVSNDTRVGLAIRDPRTGTASTSEQYSICADKRAATNVGSRNLGVIQGVSYSNQTGSTTLGTSDTYRIRLQKTGTKVQASFVSSGGSWTSMGNAVEYTGDFYKNAKFELYIRNPNSSTPVSATFTVDIVRPADAYTGDEVEDQLAVEAAASLIGNGVLITGSDSDTPDEKIAKAEQILAGNAQLSALGVNFQLSYENGFFTLKLTKGRASMIVEPFAIAVNSITVSSPVNNLVAGCAASVPVYIQGTDLSGLHVRLFGKTAGIVGGKALFSFTADEIPAAGSYGIEVLDGENVVASAGVSVVQQPAGLWHPRIEVLEDTLVVTFGADITFQESMKGVTIDGEAVSDDLISVEGNVLTIKAAPKSPFTLKILGVRYADLFPSYIFNFTIRT